MMVTKGLMMVNSDEPRLIVANTAITVIAVNHFQEWLRTVCYRC